MNGTVQEFVFDFSLRTIDKNGVIATPFHIVCHSHDLSVEEYCKTKWPQFMTAQAMSIDERTEYMRMKAYALKAAKQSLQTMDDIHTYCYTKNWMRPIDKSMDVTSVELRDVDVKLWTDPEKPFLEIDGIVYFDLAKMIKIFFDKSFVSIKRTNKLLKEKIVFEFTRAFPLFITYLEQTSIKDFITLYLTTNCNKKNSFIDTIVFHKTKLKEFYSLKKTFGWTGSKIFSVQMDHMSDIVKRRMKDHPLATGMAGVLAYDAYVKRKKRKRMKAMLTAIDKMTNFED